MNQYLKVQQVLIFVYISRFDPFCIFILFIFIFHGKQCVFSILPALWKPSLLSSCCSSFPIPFQPCLQSSTSTSLCSPPYLLSSLPVHFCLNSLGWKRWMSTQSNPAPSELTWSLSSSFWQEWSSTIIVLSHPRSGLHSNCLEKLLRNYVNL